MNRHITIHVTAGGTDGYQFSLSNGKGGAADLSFDKTADKMRKKDWYDVIFTLDNSKDTDLVFSKDPNMVLWAKPIADRTSPCPDRPMFMPGVFEVDPNSTITDTVLRVKNSDPAVQLFAFAFNFLPKGERDGPAADYICFDPIGSNQNGGVGGGGNAYALVLAVVGALIGVAVSAFGYQPLDLEHGVMFGVVGAAIGFVAGFVLGR